MVPNVIAIQDKTIEQLITLYSCDSFLLERAITRLKTPTIIPSP